MADIILVQPKAGPLETLGIRLPIGVLTVAAIPFLKGYKIKIIDQRLDDHWKNTLKQELKTNPICVGITSMTGKQIKYALEASEIVKTNSDVPVVWGGVHATLLPEQTLKNPVIDFIVTYEGDYSFTDLIYALEKGKDYSKIKGICYKKKGKFVQNPKRKTIINLDELPDLPYELVDMSKYTSLNIEGKSIDFVSSRGCPHRCSFCYNLYFNQAKWRALSAEETVKRITRLVEDYGIKTIYFQDDNFCVNIKRLEKILIQIIKQKLDINWGTLGLRIDTAKRMDTRFLRLMEKSGCVNLDIGAESGDQKILSMIDKGINIPDIISVNRKFRKYPFVLKYSFIVGIPTETRKQRISSIKLATKLTKENKKAYTPFSVYTPCPKTPLYEKALEHGFEPPDKLEDWSKFNYNEWHFNFKSWLTRKEINELWSIAFTSYFANKNIRYKINKKTTRILFDLYHPIAKYRFEKYVHFLPVDSWLGNIIANR